jgi:hypothetical protein
VAGLCGRQGVQPEPNGSSPAKAVEGNVESSGPSKGPYIWRPFRPGSTTHLRASVRQMPVSSRMSRSFQVGTITS